MEKDFLTILCLFWLTSIFDYCYQGMNNFSGWNSYIHLKWYLANSYIEFPIKCLMCARSIYVHSSLTVISISNHFSTYLIFSLLANQTHFQFSRCNSSIRCWLFCTLLGFLLRYSIIAFEINHLWNYNDFVYQKLDA